MLPAMSVLIAVALLVLVPAAGAKPKPKPKPNLVPHAKLIGTDYGFAGATVEVRVKETIENEGPGAAGPSVNELTLRHGSGESSLKDLTRNVPKLKKDARSSEVGTAKIAIPGDAKLGDYTAFLCADARNEVKEKNELDNCEEAGKFYIAKKQWTGTFAGGFDDSRTGVAETWGATDATFSFQKYMGSGILLYGVQATVIYEAGNQAGASSCAYSGTGVDGGVIGFLRIDYGKGEYTASVRSEAPPYTYPIFADCGDGPQFDHSGPDTAAVLEISTLTGGQKLPFGTDALSGSLPSAVEPDAHFTWDLK